MLLLDYPTIWSLENQPQHERLRLWDEAARFHRALRRRGIGVRFFRTGEDPGPYPLAVAPVPILLSDDAAARLRRHVDGGGTLIATFRAGAKDPRNVIRPEPPPGSLAGLFGIEVEEYDRIPDGDERAGPLGLGPFDAAGLEMLQR